LLPTVSVGERAARAGIVVALLTVTSLGFVWINGSGLLRFVGPKPPSSPAPSPADSDTLPASGKGDRLPIRGIADLADPETGPKAVAQSTEIAKVIAPVPPDRSATRGGDKSA
jgi:hypothetical protein